MSTIHQQPPTSYQALRATLQQFNMTESNGNNIVPKHYDSIHIDTRSTRGSFVYYHFGIGESNDFHSVKTLGVYNGSLSLIEGDWLLHDDVYTVGKAGKSWDHETEAMEMLQMLVDEILMRPAVTIRALHLKALPEELTIPPLKVAHLFLQLYFPSYSYKFLDSLDQKYLQKVTIFFEQHAFDILDHPAIRNAAEIEIEFEHKVLIEKLKPLRMQKIRVLNKKGFSVLAQIELIEFWIQQKKPIGFRFEAEGDLCDFTKIIRFLDDGWENKWIGKYNCASLPMEDGEMNVFMDLENGRMVAEVMEKGSFSVEKPMDALKSLEEIKAEFMKMSYHEREAFTSKSPIYWGLHKLPRHFDSISIENTEGSPKRISIDGVPVDPEVWSMYAKFQQCLNHRDVSIRHLEVIGRSDYFRFLPKLRVEELTLKCPGPIKASFFKPIRHNRLKVLKVNTRQALYNAKALKKNAAKVIVANERFREQQVVDIPMENLQI